MAREVDCAVGINKLLLYRTEVKELLDTFKVARIHWEGQGLSHQS